MIIGNGLLAITFKQYEKKNGIIIFASGVSNSNEINKKEYYREKKLLKDTIQQYKDKIIVYFSSCDVIYANKINTVYYWHKLEMENIIKKFALKYYIFRLPQLIAFSLNKNLLINYLITSIIEQKEILVWKNAYKNLINIQDVLKIIENIIKNEKSINKTINVINKNYYSIFEIIHTIENILNQKAIVKLINKGYKPNYNSDYIDKMNINFNSEYLKKSLLKNYFL